jgi:hypothetical protein
MTRPRPEWTAEDYDRRDAEYEQQRAQYYRDLTAAKYGSHVKENLQGIGLVILLFLTMFVLAVGFETLFPRLFWYH